ncbi:MAG: NTP transferase domain-containing protein [Planctomycetaceae bacterium]|jgi:spore coat polysaccharide biosynthesis protein SpsF|nr:NTP transferase domain-containing protein [Planctomycetaceae bacterium]
MMNTLGIVKGVLLTSKQRHHVARRLEGKSVLEWVVRQMTDCELLDGVVVVTDEGPNGDLIRKLSPIDVPVFSTAANDTATAVQHTLEHYSAESCLLIGADWPFLDPTLIDKLVRAARQIDQCDYAAYQYANEIFSAGRPYGLFPEYYRSASIRKLASKTADAIYRQLPGTFFLDNSSKYKVELLPISGGLDKIEDVRFTFDDEEDWDNILELHNALELDVLDSQKVGRMLSSCTNRKSGIVRT